MSHLKIESLRWLLNPYNFIKKNRTDETSLISFKFNYLKTFSFHILQRPSINVLACRIWTIKGCRLFRFFLNFTLWQRSLPCSIVMPKIQMSLINFFATLFQFVNRAEQQTSNNEKKTLILIFSLFAYLINGNDGAAAALWCICDF